MNLSVNTKQARIAEKIIRSYNRVIAQTDAAHYGRPLSALEYSKAQIKQALFVALANLDSGEIDIGESLVQSFLHLAQFIADEQADIVRRGQAAIMSGDPAHPDAKHGEQAVKLINDIKADTEALRLEVSAYIKRKAAERRGLSA